MNLVAAAVILVYVAGYIVTAVIAGRSWFDRFGVEFEGVAWAMFTALWWPVIAVPYLVWLAVRRPEA